MDQSVRKSKKPSDKKIVQQKLWAFQPIHTFKSTVIILACAGTLFLIFGIVICVEASKVVEVSKRYDNIDSCTPKLNEAQKAFTSSCSVDITLDEDMEEPIYLYYEMHNFYQNHRMYVKSRNYDQLKGEYFSTEDLDSCKPVKRIEDLEDYKPIDETKSRKDPAHPCGLVAATVFNDTFKLQNTKIKETGIAWDSDKDYKFKNAKKSKQWTDVEDEHFIVWMRIAAMPKFRKLWGVIEEDLESGTYTFEVQSNYDVSQWDGQKHLVLTTVNSLGGKNYFLGIVFLCAAGVCYLAICVFGVMQFKRKSVGDEYRPKWN